MSKTQFFEKKLLSTVISSNDPDIEDKRKDVLIELVKIKPQKLFRYRPCNEGTFDALLKDRIYFNTPINFNDPYDCVFFVDNKQVKRELDKFSTDYLLNIAKTIRNSTQPIQIPEFPNVSTEIEMDDHILQQMNDDQFEGAIDVIRKLDNSFMVFKKVC